MYSYFIYSLVYKKQRMYIYVFLGDFLSSYYLKCIYLSDRLIGE